MNCPHNFTTNVEYTYIDNVSNCNNCDAVFVLDEITFVYLREFKHGHIIQPITRVTCPNCGIKMVKMFAYCGNIDVTAEFEVTKVFAEIEKHE